MQVLCAFGRSSQSLSDTCTTSTRKDATRIGLFALVRYDSGPIKATGRLLQLGHMEVQIAMLQNPPLWKLKDRDELDLLQWRLCRNVWFLKLMNKNHSDDVVQEEKIQQHWEKLSAFLQDVMRGFENLEMVEIEIIVCFLYHFVGFNKNWKW